MAELNSTAAFHRDTPVDLGKEFTICESFSTPDSPYCVALDEPRAYGAMVGDFLVKHSLLKPAATILEVGGGYGSLMQGLLSAYGHRVRRVYMADLSRGLLRRQRETLLPWRDRITFICADLQELIPAIHGIDLIIVNEVIGDLDTLCDIDTADIPEPARGLVRTYGLETPPAGSFNLNIGAIRLTEALCRTNIPVLLTEHCCDPVIPEDMPFLGRDLALDSFPRRIPLQRHCEYTIRFSHLIRVARALKRQPFSGALLDIVTLSKTPALRTIFTTRACATERQEIIYELLDHIREYRWLIIR